MICNSDAGRCTSRAENFMQDAIFIALIVAFFAVCIAYVHFCDAMK
jgi:hypothetical protein